MTGKKRAMRSPLTALENIVPDQFEKGERGLGAHLPMRGLAL